MGCDRSPKTMGSRLVLCMWVVYVDWSVPTKMSFLSLLTGQTPGILAMGAVNNFITAGFVLAIAELNHPDLVVTRWKVTLVAFAVAFSGLSFNTLAPHLLHKASILAPSNSVVTH